MYLKATWGCCCCSNRRLDKLYKLGTEQIEKEMDVVKLLKTLRNLKIIVKAKLLDDPLLKL